ncbi:MAG: RlmE family RNA methyltransferase [Nitrososphaerota archaeon]|nr:RlmE family RNA methyltransferase [Nitrososphaerota archaeon]MDG6967424.1 RlmE family RNA methyltransferase [Nitrososphaerota archaeon]MDG6977855.1 RlmE family RNA methyltransferase [Nitrososphaerota archaeon]MDG7020898.1 RlmE family RNA methyltransferase [Nitrososphaerota archaeon]
MRLEEAKRDQYRRLAREEGYKSRAAYKLLESVRKYGLVKKGDVVLDFGAAPGGWLQVAAEAAGPSGLVVGVDLEPVDLDEANVVTIQSDVRSPDLPLRLDKALPRKADVVLSDLSPQVMGTWDLDHFRQIEITMAAAGLMRGFLREGGDAMFKVFDGERFGEMRSTLVAQFEKVHVTKPKASRKGSAELYLVCLGYRPASRTAATTSG